MYKLVFKRMFDILGSLVLGILFFPVFLLILAVMVLSGHGAPFFTQIRPGKKEKLFTLIKFRTMNNKRDVNGKLLPDFERMTPIGSFLRKTSLDEVPQLINVLKGDMSLVGPRPLLPEYLPLYNAFQARRHEVLPGITGWAQVNGRNAIRWENKFALDVWYVDHISLSTDIRILWLTLLKVFRRENVNVSRSVTMERFTGNID
jgi:undecaprenyl phosphate N,N'-diacetylbacillosamine 1-phosphate transferase